MRNDPPWFPHLIVMYHWRQQSLSHLLEIRQVLTKCRLFAGLRSVGSKSWQLSLATARANKPKWLSLVVLRGKRHSEVSHVLGGGPRQRRPCKTQPEAWLWDRVLEDSVLTVPCPGACWSSSCAGGHQHQGRPLLLLMCTPSLSAYRLHDYPRTLCCSMYPPGKGYIPHITCSSSMWLFL